MFKFHWMSKILLGIMVFLLLFGSVAISNAWQLTVWNPTDTKCKVTVWDHRFAVLHDLGTVTIQPSSSNTWSTGGYCPSCMEGKIWDGNAYRYIKWTNCLGNEIGCADGCSACCWNSTWHICRKRGSGTIHDYDYGFCKGEK